MVQAPQGASLFDGVPVGLYRQYNAGTDRLAVKKDGAGSADAVLTTDMGARQPEVMSQKVPLSGQSWLDIQLVFSWQEPLELQNSPGAQAWSEAQMQRFKNALLDLYEISSQL